MIFLLVSGLSAFSRYVTGGVAFAHISTRAPSMFSKVLEAVKDTSSDMLRLH